MDIKELGLKTTKARVGLLEILKTGRPLDVAESIKLLKKRGIKADQATVYRSLATFSKKGVVREIHFNDGVVRFELAKRPEHHHAVCIKCGSVEDIMDCSVEKIEKEIQTKKGFTVMNHSLEFFGVCKKCKSKKS